MKEQDFEDILSKYPELIEEGLTLKGRQVHVRGKYVDLLFEDRHGHTLIVELKKGVIKREHIAQLLDYEGHFLSPDDPTVRVMLIGNRVPPNLRRSLDHHGFEWREIKISNLIEFLKEQGDEELLDYFAEDEVVPRRKPAPSRPKAVSYIRSGKGAPQLHTVQSFEELKEVIRIRSKYYPINYMDLLLLENEDKALSQIIEVFRKYAERINFNDFHDVPKLRQHLKFREERGWVFDYSGDPQDPVVSLVGVSSDQDFKMKRQPTPSTAKNGKDRGRIFTPDQFFESSYFRLCSPTSQSLLRHLMGRADTLGMRYVMKIRGDDAVTMSHTDEHGRNFVTLRPRRDSLNVEIFRVTGRVPYHSPVEIDKALVPLRIKEKYDEICEQLSLKSISMKPAREQFWTLLLDKTEEVCAEEGLALEFSVGSDGRYAKAPTGIARVSWAYAIAGSTAWVELEIRGKYSDEVYSRLSEGRNRAGNQFQSEIGERIYWDKEAHYSGKDREVYRITSDSKYLFFDTGEGWNELVDDLSLRMVAFVKTLQNYLQSIADTKS